MPAGNRKKRLFVHIGLNKTGSTYIQRCLVKNAALLEENGFLYPCKKNSAYFQRGQHVPLAVALTGAPVYWLRAAKKRNLPKALPLFLKEAEEFSGSNVIISSEAFGSKHILESSVERVLELLKAFEVHAVVYLRRQDDYLLSTYQQDVKVGSSQPFNLDERMALDQNKFLERLTPWVSLLGQDRVIIRRYEKAHWIDGNLFLDFLSAIGCTPENVELIPDENEGLDYRYVNILREINHCLSPLGDGAEGSFDQSVRANILSYLRKLHDPDTPVEKLTLSSAEVQKVRDFFLEDNQRIWGEDGASIIQVAQNGRAGNTQDEALDTDMLIRLAVEICRDNVRLKNKLSKAATQS